MTHHTPAPANMRIGPDPLNYRYKEDEAARRQRLAWFSKARIGLFVHHFVEQPSESRGNPIPEQDYDERHADYAPTNLDPQHWAELARQFGAKYLVYTAKHHNGFCWWPSAETDHHVGNTPCKRDLVAETAAACKAKGLHFGLYCTVMDWHHPLWPTGRGHGGSIKEQPDMSAFQASLHRQINELAQYKPELLWFDGEWEWPWTHERGLDLYRHCRDALPQAIINDRCDRSRQGRKGISSGTLAPGLSAADICPELYVYFRSPRPEEDYAGDFRTFEQERCSPSTDCAAETCLTIGSHWGWHSDDHCKSLTELFAALIHAVGNGSNLLLNISVRPDGSIPMGQQRRLLALGDWIERHAEAIYATQAGPLRNQDWGATTQTDDYLYILVLDTTRQQLQLPDLASLGQWQQAQGLDGTAVETHIQDQDVGLELQQHGSGDEPYVIRCPRA